MDFTSDSTVVRGFSKGRISTYKTPQQVIEFLCNISLNDPGDAGGGDDGHNDQCHSDDKPSDLHSTHSLEEMPGPNDFRNVDVFEQGDEIDVGCPKIRGDGPSPSPRAGRRDAGPRRPAKSLITASLHSRSSTTQPLRDGQSHPYDVESSPGAWRGNRRRVMREQVSRIPLADKRDPLGSCKPYMDERKHGDDDTAKILREIPPRF